MSSFSRTNIFVTLEFLLFWPPAPDMERHQLKNIFLDFFLQYKIIVKVILKPGLLWNLLSYRQDFLFKKTLKQTGKISEKHELRLKLLTLDLRLYYSWAVKLPDQDSVLPSIIPLCADVTLRLSPKGRSLECSEQPGGQCASRDATSVEQGLNFPFTHYDLDTLGDFAWKKKWVSQSLTFSADTYYRH